MSKEKKLKTITMNTKEVKDCFALISRPISPLKIGQRVPEVIFTITPQGKIGTGYSFLVECSVPICWSKMQSAFHLPTKQRLLPEEGGKYPI